MNTVSPTRDRYYPSSAYGTAARFELSIDLHLVRVLHTVIAERSVSRAALRLQTTQPVISAQLKRLRELTGDPLLVRCRPRHGAHRRSAADAGAAPSACAGSRVAVRAQQRQAPFAPAASDDDLPHRCQRLPRPAVPAGPGGAAEGAGARRADRDACRCRREFDYRRKLAAGDVDLVIGNWLQPPERIAPGPPDEPTRWCAWSRRTTRRRATRAAGRSSATWTAEHVAPTPLHAGGRGVIDEHLQAQGLARRIVVRARALRPDPADGGAQVAGADHRAPVLHPLPRRAAGADRALPGRLSAAGLLPAVARADARVGRRCAGCASRCATWRASLSASARAGASEMTSPAPARSAPTCWTSPATPGWTDRDDRAVRYRADHWLLVDGRPHRRRAGRAPGPDWQRDRPPRPAADAGLHRHPRAQPAGRRDRPAGAPSCWTGCTPTPSRPSAPWPTRRVAAAGVGAVPRRAAGPRHHRGGGLSRPCTRARPTPCSSRAGSAACASSPARC